jgi:hypothetical protein
MDILEWDHQNEYNDNNNGTHTHVYPDQTIVAWLRGGASLASVIGSSFVILIQHCASIKGRMKE